MTIRQLINLPRAIRRREAQLKTWKQEQMRRELTQFCQRSREQLA